MREQAPAEVVSDRTQTQALVSVARDEVPYYVAVVAADANGNYSALAETSVFGPVRSVDNVPPDPVQGVRADDAPADRGGRLRVRWTPNEDPTVREYRLYVLVRVPQSEADLNRALAAVAVEWEEGSLPETLVPSEGDGLDRYVAVVAVDGSGNRSALDAGSVAGPVRSVVNVLEAMGPVRVGAGFDRQSSVFVPAAAVVPGMRIDILPVEEPLLRSVQEANQNLAEAHIDPETEELLLDTVRWVDSNQERFRVPLTLTLGYPIQIEGEVLQDLRLFRLNDRLQPARWELVPGTHTRNELDRTLSAPIETPGVYRLARLLLPRLLDQVVVYPNPFRIQQDGVVIFRNLTREARIEIFTLDGRRVKRILPNGSGSATWDGRNENGDPVASGLYLFLIVAPTDRRTGQLFVVR
ncbi:MAG: hypothetical protein KatS3mg115_0141 [Candidatus Poribacteria bacterium]|nr:MAG: hypothetical protein KatS3mg115_0141 [Candidatus Poribacteria bacterium]